MYSGAGPSVIKESLRGLLTAAGTLSRIARVYGTPERMTTLLSKVTNQMMKACRWEVWAKKGRATARILHGGGLLTQVSTAAAHFARQSCPRHLGARGFILAPGNLWEQPRPELIANLQVRASMAVWVAPRLQWG